LATISALTASRASPRPHLTAHDVAEIDQEIRMVPTAFASSRNLMGRQVALTPVQKKLRSEILEIAIAARMDFWNIENHQQPPFDRTALLKIMIC